MEFVMNINFIIWVVTSIIAISLSSVFFITLKKISEERFRKEMGESPAMAVALITIFGLIPIFNIVFIILSSKELAEEIKKYKKEKSIQNDIQKEKDENPHWEDLKNYSKVLNGWCGPIKKKELTDYFKRTHRTINENLENEVIKYLLREHSLMISEVLAISKEIEGMEEEKKRKVQEEWLEVLKLFAEEIEKFRQLERTIEDEVQTKKMERMLESAEQNKKRMKKTRIEEIYKQAVGK